jgi:peptide deformylase
MAKLKIYTYPDNVLAMKAKPVPRVDKSLFQFADDMLETMYDAVGVGLAANQVGILMRALVLDVQYDIEKLPESEVALLADSAQGKSRLINKKPEIIFNPEIIYKEGTEVFQEGCLSVPEYYAEVKRSKKIKMRFQDIDGVTRVMSAEGLLADCIQHEMDHLDGRLFIDRLSPLKKEMIKKKLRLERLERDQELSSGSHVEALLNEGTVKKSK